MTGTQDDLISSFMRKLGNNKSTTDQTGELVRDLLIVQLGLAGLSNVAIRTIAKCDQNRVTTIVKHIRAAQRGSHG